MLFDYKNYLQELREHAKPEKRKIIERWDKVSNADSIQEEPYYAYLKKFKTLPYKIPEELSNDFDWELLLQLAASSFSSELAFVFTDSEENVEFTKEMLLPELSIDVSSENQRVCKDVSELWSFQILRLFEIYLEEQINLHMLKTEDDSENDAIEAERERILANYEKKYNEAQNIIKRKTCFV